MTLTLFLVACLTEPPADSGSDSTPTTDSTRIETGTTDTGTTPTTDTAHTAAGCPVFPAVEGVRRLWDYSLFTSYAKPRRELFVATADTQDALALVFQGIEEEARGGIPAEDAAEVDWKREFALVGWYSEVWVSVPFGLSEIQGATAPNPIITSWCVSNDSTHFETSSTSIQVVAYPREWGTEVEATLTVIE